MLRIIAIAGMLLMQQSPRTPEPMECDAHICHCKGMQDADPYDDDGNIKASACRTRCKKNACCCPVPKVDSIAR